MIALVALVLAAPPADATDSIWLDVGVTAGAAAGWAALWSARRDLGRTSCPCDPDDVNALDRPAVDYRWRHGERAADAAVGLALVAPLLGLAFAAPDARAWAGDALLVTESALVTGLATQAAKAAASRPFPYMHDDPYPEQNGDAINYQSMWSGHTAVPMAAAVTFAMIVERRAPAWRAWAWSVGPALALLGGALQVSAGNHFATDVMVGGAVGAGAGWANATLHRF